MSEAFMYEVGSFIKENKNPTKWDIVFFKEAILWRENSHDNQTQCGCVLVKDKTSISTGYNGFIRDINDDVLPRTRPQKYPFMIHAEANAIYNSVRLGRSTLNSTAYITGAPCLNCLQMLYQCGVYDIRFTDVSKIKMDIFSEEYLSIMKLIKDKISMSFTPQNLILKGYSNVQAEQRENKGFRF
jgi:dCMP deaminase